MALRGSDRLSCRLVGDDWTGMGRLESRKCGGPLPSSIDRLEDPSQPAGSSVKRSPDLYELACVPGRYSADGIWGRRLAACRAAADRIDSRAAGGRNTQGGD